jgi:pyruvate/2-oxoglutarate dehydrogenase complex dihydrolipoamide acyltransferase (E2) component
MKRCPQCEFIYEDDQSLCDMDGVLLVFDSRSLPNLHALAPTNLPVPVKAPRRIPAVPAFATLILVVVLGLVYYVSTRSASLNSYSPASSPSSATSTSDALSVPATTDKSSEAPPAAPEPTPAPKQALQPAAPKPSVTPAKKAPARAAAAQPEAKKDDSKVGSILKKTGRILKKPFKF